MKYSLIPTAQTVVQHCQANDISNIVISPGSRNAPLTIAFAENPFFSCFSIVDERCAAFFALGMAQQLKKPVVVLCTSGSALLNYYPAIAEAYFSNIPLIVISADRPIYKVGIGDGQTINQKNVYENHIGYSANLKQDVTHSTDKITQYKPDWIKNRDVLTVQNEVQKFNDNELNNVLNTAITGNYPVHINVPFEEPLYKTIAKLTVHPNIQPIYKKEIQLPSLNFEKNIWNTSKRKMVLVGVNTPNSIAENIILNLANDPSVIVLTETTSNLYHPNFFNSIDSIIAPIELNDANENLFESLKPDVLITFGGLIVSKKVKAFLRTYSPKHHWHIDGTNPNDTFFCLKKHIKTSVNSFFGIMYNNSVEVKSNYFSFWNRKRNYYVLKRAEYVNEIPFSDFAVFNSVLQAIPNNYLLQLANSSTIRYTQLFDLNSSLTVNCNRGTSGIDGSTSTAIGASIVSKTPTLFITGDLSFFYDSNALWNDYVRNDFRIIVINNKGGGIFRILPGKENNEVFEKFFETRHNLNAQQLCSMFGFHYAMADCGEKLDKEMTLFFKDSGQPKLLEIVTPSLINDKILIDYFRFIS
ncbi:2-succinyl-5-enolpyruvyl-6-hydroxy-3-cyclohexene-1-carboxylic-acid synthase [Maribacter hydrothermalis]|uniref:2-succinyl-5-enolpyruvyl-6-hydroxy-3-cyclohexene-1-carboxylate synthase n=1 Tax=Maribacter hydrothermalis TaxID=1836467 RepID=A0A1B7ZCQ3_9FLAO|nr:2-succinyl-5-enolpyruvyl-6-hydroxy-3-cyclohexene-1-carboxylic-acid synthase [Maribacter hydrothermalis]APQ18539.1 2-succinyl-5-enolpyruvyl-6-hydroxy-3-cyclohexene-1-carboxylic-acid synthase [Maribacter hydrothermalis]OBR40906.1 2-succinyl-5-enolpyruvyl-6-hydroxy-3-cyclohexene-1-carboxylic-acid synthase [Maribacter hydrothermalis]